MTNPPKLTTPQENQDERRLDLISGVLVDLVDICRLTQTPGMAPFIKTTSGLPMASFRQKIAWLLSPVEPGRSHPEKEDVLDGADLENIDSTEIKEFIETSGEAKLLEHQNKIRQLLQTVLGHPQYRQAVHDYLNQSYSAEVRADHYKFLSHLGFLEIPLVGKDQKFYHGISLGEFGDDVDNPEETQLKMEQPGDYFDRIDKVLKQGIRATEYPENLPGLESISCSENINYVQGIAGVWFRLTDGEKLWGRTLSEVEGRHLVQPVKKPPFHLVLRSPAFYDAKDQLEVSDIFSVVNRKYYKRFIRKLIAHLRTAEFPFQMIDPNGKTRNPGAEDES